MSRIRLHYDGWLGLPAILRRELNLATGDELEAAVVDGAIVLSPIGDAAQPATAPAAAPEPRREASAPAKPAAQSKSPSKPAAPAAAPRKRTRSAPIKQVPVTLKGRGRRKSASGDSTGRSAETAKG